MVADLNFWLEVGTKPDIALTPSTFIECLLSILVSSPTETVTSYFPFAISACHMPSIGVPEKLVI